jgi:hypothetical protein
MAAARAQHAAAGVGAKVKRAARAAAAGAAHAAHDVAEVAQAVRDDIARELGVTDDESKGRTRSG